MEHSDVIYCTEEEKYQAIANEIEQLNKWDTLNVGKEDPRSGRSSRKPRIRISLPAARQSQQQETIPKVEDPVDSAQGPPGPRRHDVDREK